MTARGIGSSPPRRGEPLDALVVGAGIVGSALALGLARRGLTVALLEAGPVRPWRAELADPRVYALAEDGRALLDALGVWSAVRDARVCRYLRMRIWDAAGGRPLDFDANAFGVPQLGHIVEHGLLVDRLGRALAAEGVVVHDDRALEGFEQGPELATVHAADGLRLRARWVFAADGAQSTLREQAGIAVDRRDYAAQGLVATLQPEEPHQRTCWQRFLPSGPLALLPLSDGRISIVWSLPEAEARHWIACPEAQFEAALTRASDRVLGALTLVSPRIGLPLQRQLASTMQSGRLALLGDAAHVVHPLAGQGMNLGLRDVAGLLQGIDRARLRGREPLSATLLQRWARQRQSENTLAAHAFETIHRVFSNVQPLPVALRGWALAAANLEPVRRLLWRRANGG